MFQKRNSNVLGKNTSLTNVIHVMLFCRVLPCQLRASPMWEFNAEEPRTLNRFFGTTHEDIWKQLFKAQKSWPMKTEDIGLNSENPASAVSITFPKSSLAIASDMMKIYIILFPHRAGRRRRSGSTVRRRYRRTQPLPS